MGQETDFSQQGETHGKIILEAIGLTKHFRKKLALNSISFQLYQGECLGIAGHNGSGKSTLLSLISQTRTPDSGEILYRGKNVLGDRAFLRKNMGYIPQEDGLLEDLTVAETLHAWQSLGESEDHDALNEAIWRMGIGDFVHKRIGDLSGGMKKRVSIAIALLNRPNILIMDEVSNALDRQFGKALETLIADFTKQGGSVLYCSHQQEDLLQFCDRLLILQGSNAVFYDRCSALPQDRRERDRLFELENA